MFDAGIDGIIGVAPDRLIGNEIKARHHVVSKVMESCFTLALMHGDDIDIDHSRQVVLTERA